MDIPSAQQPANRGAIKLSVEITARDSEGNVTGHEVHPDISVQALAQQIMLNILDAAVTISDVSNTGRSLTANDAATAPFIVAGTTATAPAFTDYALGDGTTNTNYKSNSSYAQAATVNTTLSSNTFTITATITNGGTANITYKEVGLANTIATFQFLLAHDQVNGGTGYVVSASGTLAVTYTGTFT